MYALSSNSCRKNHLIIHNFAVRFNLQQQEENDYDEDEMDNDIAPLIKQPIRGINLLAEGAE